MCEYVRVCADGGLFPVKDAEPGRVKNASQPRVNGRSSRRGERESQVSRRLERKI